MMLFDLLCSPAFAHEGVIPVTVSASVWWEWRAEWGLLTLLLFAGAFYFRLFQQAAQALGKELSRNHLGFFWAGLLSIYLAVASPIDRIGEEYLFSMHMVQHNLFMYLTTRLLLAGIPEWLAEFWLQKMGTWAQKAYRFVAHPIMACILFNVVFTLWHIPFLYDWALQDRMVHNLEHATMIITAMILWLPLWSPLKALRPIYPVQMLYLVGVAIGQLPVFAYVTFSSQVLYPTYAMAPRLTPLTAIADQQLGGVIMKIVGMFFLLITFSMIFMNWYKSEQARDEAQTKLPQPSPVPLQT